MFVSFLLCCFNGHRASQRDARRRSDLRVSSSGYLSIYRISKRWSKLTENFSQGFVCYRSLPCLSCTTSSIAKMSMFYFFHLGHRRPKAFAKLRRLSESQKSLTDFNIFRSSFQPPPRLPFQKRVQRSAFSPNSPNFLDIFFEKFSHSRGYWPSRAWLTGELGRNAAAMGFMGQMGRIGLMGPIWPIGPGEPGFTLRR